jgi:hypothetical protein
VTAAWWPLTGAAVAGLMVLAVVAWAPVALGPDGLAPPDSLAGNEPAHLAPTEAPEDARLADTHSPTNPNGHSSGNPSGNGPMIAAEGAQTSATAPRASKSPVSSEVAPSTRVAAHPRSGSGAVGFADGLMTAADGRSWSAGQPLIKAKLNRLLIGHQERVSASSLKGFLPYATLVGYSTQP